MNELQRRLKLLHQHDPNAVELTIFKEQGMLLPGRIEPSAAIVRPLVGCTKVINIIRREVSFCIAQAQRYRRTQHTSKLAMVITEEACGSRPGKVPTYIAQEVHKARRLHNLINAVFWTCSKAQLIFRKGPSHS